ncbi:hypothetical protein WT60_04850 [Burkholderia sp. MSMB617WGS]|nr:hypothetical protein WT60_04850 [Burkholderia sp. MSMB617WGS]KWZ45298.1 hypothetical protein WS73_13925 [Burkholderia savannae]
MSIVKDRDVLFETISSRHGELTLFANDTGALSESLRKYGEWAENELSFMLSTIRAGDTVIDVGAYIGTHSLAFARRVGAAGQVVSIEAQPRSFELLTRNMHANGLVNVRLENAIASATAKDEHIPSIDIMSPGSYGSASLRDALNPRASFAGQEAIDGPHESLTSRSVAIDDLSVPSCALIKIDVEGMEDMVLRGGVSTIRRCEPVVYAECNSLEDGLRALNVLKEFDYRVRAHVVLAYNAENFRGESENIFGRAREVALVGTPRGEHDPLRQYAPRACELVLDIETADDLALALMNKPQYEHEVLRACAAARSGGTVCLDEKYEARGEDARVAELVRAIDVLREHHAAEIHALREQHAVDLAALDGKQAAERDALRRDLGECRDEERRFAEQVASLEGALAQIYRSRSWRLTAPLRSLKRALWR